MIKLIRVVMKERPEVDYTTCVTFEDLDGKVLSLAFNGSYEKGAIGAMGEHLTYNSYSDCPVIDHNNEQHTKMGDMQTMRVMRDSLNRMNLGD